MLAGEWEQANTDHAIPNDRSIGQIAKRVDRRWRDPMDSPSDDQWSSDWKARQPQSWIQPIECEWILVNHKTAKASRSSAGIWWKCPFCLCLLSKECGRILLHLDYENLSERFSTLFLTNLGNRWRHIVRSEIHHRFDRQKTVGRLNWSTRVLSRRCSSVSKWWACWWWWPTSSVCYRSSSFDWNFTNCNICY